ncbi:hypothetical protein [Streptomyces sp. NPDC059631]|uniref:hypothetical protein n=1 Tax=unclassified Streptomyces TaxID=2593676 RepID=UPI00369359BB
MPENHSVSCVENGARSSRRLGGAEAAVIIVITTLAASLVALAGMSPEGALQVLVGAGLTSAAVLGLTTRAPGRWPRSVVKALLAPAV